MCTQSSALTVLFKGGKKGCGLTDLVRIVSDEQTARHLFEEIGLIPVTARCECGSRFLMKHKDPHGKLGFRWYCTAVNCGKRFSPLRNTWFERSHLSFLKVITILSLNLIHIARIQGAYLPSRISNYSSIGSTACRLLSPWLTQSYQSTQLWIGNPSAEKLVKHFV